MGKMSEEQLNDEQETRRVTVLKYILNNCNLFNPFILNKYAATLPDKKWV